MKSILQTTFTALAIISSIVALLLWAMPKYDTSERLHVTKVDWGTVISIGDNCRSSKHSLRCQVKTTTHTFNDLDITRFSGNILHVNDKIFLEEHIYPRSQRTLLCRNNTCMPQGVCFDWMPCYDESKVRKL